MNSARGLLLPVSHRPSPRGGSYKHAGSPKGKSRYRTVNYLTQRGAHPSCLLLLALVVCALAVTLLARSLAYTDDADDRAQASGGAGLKAGNGAAASSVPWHSSPEMYAQYLTRKAEQCKQPSTWTCGCKYPIYRRQKPLDLKINLSEEGDDVPEVLIGPDDLGGVPIEILAETNGTAASGVSSIPRRFHFVSRMFQPKPGASADSEDFCGDVPCEYKKYMDKFRVAYSQVDDVNEWEFYLHCPEDIEALLTLRSPEWKHLYEGYKNDIQRSDLSRYVVLYHYGGMYADMDVEPRTAPPAFLSQPSFSHIKVFLGIEGNMKGTKWLQKKMDKLHGDCEALAVQNFFHGETVLPKEPSDLAEKEEEDEDTMAIVCKACSPAIKQRDAGLLMGCIHPIRGGHPEKDTRISNFWMTTAQRHPFFRDVIELASRRAHYEINVGYDVIYTTGPDVVSEVYSLYSDLNQASDVHAVSQETMYSHVDHHTNLGHGWRQGLNDDEICETVGIC